MRRRWFVIPLLAVAFGCQTLRETACRTEFFPGCCQLENHPAAQTIAAFDTPDALPVVYVASEEGDMATQQSGDPLEVSLASAIATALDRNPDLITLRSSEPVGHATLDLARTYPFNPYLQTEVYPYGRERDGQATSVAHLFQLIHTFELARQSRDRVAGALAGLSRTQWTILQSELQTVAQTERLFFNAIYCRALRDLARAIAETNQRLLGVMQRRYEAGQANTADVATVKWDARSSRQEADLAEANYATARFALYRQLDLSPDVALELVGDLARCRWLPIREGTPGTGSGAADPDDPATRLTDADIERLVTARPDVLAACADLDAAAASLSLARAGRVPNLQLGPVYERDDAGTLFFGFKSQVDVPVVNTGKSLVQQRIAEYCQRRITAQQLEAKAAIEGKTAVRRYERAREAVGRAKRDFAETLPDELRQIENLFQAGQVDLPRVFAARSSVLQSRRAYLDLLNEAAQSAADVTATIGLPPDELVVMPAGDDDRAARHSGRQVDAM